MAHHSSPTQQVHPPVHVMAAGGSPHIATLDVLALLVDEEEDDKLEEVLEDVELDEELEDELEVELLVDELEEEEDEEEGEETEDTEDTEDEEGDADDADDADDAELLEESGGRQVCAPHVTTQPFSMTGFG